MSYSVSSPCYNCKKNQNVRTPEGKCSDMQEVQEAVNKIHSKTFDQGHQGAGSITLMCCRQEPIS